MIAWENPVLPGRGVCQVGVNYNFSEEPEGYVVVAHNDGSTGTLWCSPEPFDNIHAATEWMYQDFLHVLKEAGLTQEDLVDADFFEDDICVEIYGVTYEWAVRKIS